MKILLYITSSVLFLSSCSIFKSQVELNEYVSITTSPSSSEIYNESGELLGVSPLKLTREKLSLAQKNSIVSIVVKKLNHIERQVVFKNEGVSEINVNLVKLDSTKAKELIAGPLSNDVNELIKKIILVQEGIITRKIIDSTNLIKLLIKDYPSLASIYILEAAIDIQNKNFEQAKIVLEKSLMLDANNELGKSYLNFVNMRIRNE